MGLMRVRMVRPRPAVSGLLLALAAGIALAAFGARWTGAVELGLPVGWSEGASLPGSFTPRWDFAYAYFPPTDKVVLFGGGPKVHDEGWKNDTWTYNGTSWSLGPVAPPGLTPRAGATMAYHPVIGKLVLFGGTGTSWPPLNETWLYNGTSWTKGPTAPAGLAGRTGASMAYHPGIGKLVLFGGSGETPFR